MHTWADLPASLHAINVALSSLWQFVSHMRIYPRPTPSRSLFKHWRAPIELDIKDEHPRACPTCPLMCPPQNTFTSRHIRCFYIPNAGCFTHIDCIAKKTVSAGQGMQQSMWKCRSTRRSAVEQHDAWRAAMEVIIGVIAPDCGNVKQCVCIHTSRPLLRLGLLENTDTSI